jgi:hypothetical protein
MESKMFLRPPETPDTINGRIIYIDIFGNVVLNISQQKFDRVGHGRGFTLFFKRNEIIETISQSYREVPEGERLCLFNSAGNLEIAINKGNAQRLFGLSLDDKVQILFQ